MLGTRRRSSTPAVARGARRCGLTLALAGVLAAETQTATAAACPPLAPPSGALVSVSSEAQLQAAVASLRPGTTILLDDGVYELTRTLFLPAVNGFAIRGRSGMRDAVVLRGRGMANPDFGMLPHGLVVASSDVLIADLTIRDFYHHNVQVRGESGARNVRLYNVRLIDAGEQHVKGSTAGAPGPYGDDGLVACSSIEYTDRARSGYTNGVDVIAGANWVIRDNVFRNIRGPLGQQAGPAVLMWGNSLDSVVERNVFIDCDRGVALGLGPPGELARDRERTYDHQGGVVRNNFIVHSPGSPGDVGITANHARDYRILHNTVMLNGVFPWTIEYRFASSRGEVAYNLTDGPILSRDGAAASLVGNVTSAQAGLFLDAVAGDLHLAAAAGSAIDRAGPRADVPDDFDGERRPLGAAPDVGADERSASSAAAHPRGRKPASLAEAR